MDDVAAALGVTVAAEVTFLPDAHGGTAAFAKHAIEARSTRGVPPAGLHRHRGEA